MMPPLMKITRAIGAQVCKVRGHLYYYPGGAIDTCCAYSCIRCRELDRPLESLEPRPLDEDYDYCDWDRFEDDQRDFEYFCRWFSWLPFPRWL